MGHRLGSETAAPMIDFYNGVPDSMRRVLTWHPDPALRELPGRSGT